MITTVCDTSFANLPFEILNRTQWMKKNLMEISHEIITKMQAYGIRMDICVKDAALFVIDRKLEYACVLAQYVYTNGLNLKLYTVFFLALL